MKIMQNKEDCFSDLTGKVITKITASTLNTLDAPDKIIFELENGDIYKLYHYQDCCEDVYIEDICGDFDDLIGTPIVSARMEQEDDDSFEYGVGLWIFYKLDTIKGGITIR